MWTIKLKLDADSNDVGSITATWTEPGGEVFTFSQNRIKNSTAEINAFGVAAVAERDAWQAKEALNLSGAAFLLDKLNTYDPKVVM